MSFVVKWNRSILVLWGSNRGLQWCRYHFVFIILSFISADDITLGDHYVICQWGRCYSYTMSFLHNVIKLDVAADVMECKCIPPWEFIVNLSTAKDHQYKAWCFLCYSSNENKQLRCRWPHRRSYDIHIMHTYVVRNSNNSFARSSRPAF